MTLPLPQVRLQVSRDGRADVRGWIRDMALAGLAYVDLYPSGVIHALSEARNARLLAIIGQALADRAEAAAGPKIRDAAADGDRGAIERALRYYAYRYIELLWEHAAAGGWGQASRERQLEKDRRGYPVIGAYGVAQRGTRRAWYGIAKGQRQPADPHDQGADARVGTSAEIDVVIK